MNEFGSTDPHEISIPSADSTSMEVDRPCHIYINGRELPECETYGWFEAAIHEKAARERLDENGLAWGKNIPKQGEWVSTKDFLPTERDGIEGAGGDIVVLAMTKFAHGYYPEVKPVKEIRDAKYFPYWMKIWEETIVLSTSTAFRINSHWREKE